MSIKGITTVDLKKKAHTPDELTSIIYENYSKIDAPGIDARKLLITIAKMESSFGADCRPRFEPAYYPGGLYFKKSKELQFAFEHWGALVSFSYGPFQIMWVVAHELGFPNHQPPLDLWSGHFSAPFVVKYINRSISKGATKVEQILATYNGGLGALKNPNDAVKRYVLKGLSIYQSL